MKHNYQNWKLNKIKFRKLSDAPSNGIGILHIHIQSSHYPITNLEVTIGSSYCSVPIDQNPLMSMLTNEQVNQPHRNLAPLVEHAVLNLINEFFYPDLQRTEILATTYLYISSITNPNFEF